MNILLINHYAGSREMGMEYRPYYLARHWVRMGHQVTIVTASFSHLRLKNPEIHGETEARKIDGINYVFLKTPGYSHNDRKRAFNVFSFVRQLYFLAPTLAQSYRPDVVIASSTYPYDIRPARRIARLSGAKLVYELHDIWPLSPMELYGYSRSHPLMAYTKIEADYAFEKSDLVVSLLPFADQYLAEQGLTVQRYVHIPNGVEIEGDPPRKPPQKHLDLLGRYREKGMFIVLYVGGFSAANSLEDFIKAAGRCGEDVMFITVGNGPLKVGYKKHARLCGINNILFLDGLPKDQLPEVLALADALYIGAKHTGLYRYGVSMNKLFDYMLAAKPIIFGVDAANNPVNEAGCGVTIESEDADAIVRAVEQLKSATAQERAEMGRKGRVYVEQRHDYAKLAQNFLDAVEELSAAPAKREG